MDNSILCKWLKSLILVLSACALVMTLVSFPGRAFAGWFLFATGLLAAGVVAVLAYLQRRNGQRAMRNFLFADSDAATLWLVVRVYVGSVWLQAGLMKLFGSGWTNGGLGLKAFWARAISGSPGTPSQIPYPWYRELLHLMLAQHAYTWFAWVITISEVSIGLLLLLGLCTGLAACAGGGLNLLYLLAGSISTNPVMLIFSLFLLLAWRVAGYYGLDRLFLPAIANRLAAHRNMELRVHEIAAQPWYGIQKRQTPSLVLDTPRGFE